MNEKIYSLAKELDIAISSDPRFILLDELEKRMEKDDEVIALAYKKDTLVSAYSDVLKYYNEDSEEVKKIKKELIDAKDALNSHPLVKEYNKAYEEVRLILLEINRILFKDFRGNC